MCGVDIPFSAGLNIIRADNSTGKSTCMQAVIYALGLEGMLSPRRTVPLPHAMTDILEVDGVEMPVEQSWVSLEIENEHGAILTVRRDVKNASVDRGLIRTVDGPALTGSLAAEATRDFFVRRSGAARREQGFHYQLAKFLGWTLPKVTYIDGREDLLYLECLFPYFYVEQKHGWSGVQARIPAYFGIRDVSKRSAEFILALDSYNSAMARQRLEASAAIMVSEWRETVKDLESSARAIGVVISGMPRRPAEDSLRRSTAHVAGEQWRSLEQELSWLRQRIETTGAPPKRSEDEANLYLERQLAETQAQLAANDAVLREALADVEAARARHESLTLRITMLEADLERHRDAATLRRLGSVHTQLLGDGALCPTCGQRLVDGFEVTRRPMSPDESIESIEQELRTFRAMSEDASRFVSMEEVKVRQLRNGATGLRRQVSSIKESLTNPSTMPTLDQVTERLRLEDRLSALTALADQIIQIHAELEARSVDWRQNRERLAELDVRGGSSADVDKVAYLSGSFVGQLNDYGVSSLDPRALEISPETYRPTHEGFDLGFDLSASDMIRVIWAYLMSLLEASQRYSGRHPLLLMFDEPRQQETSRLSFESLLRRAAQNGDAGAQIVFATSEEAGSLNAMLSSVRHSLVSFSPGRKILGQVS